MKEFEEQLLRRLKGAKRVLFMGIGEEKMSDDAIGIYIASELLGCNDDRFKIINAGIDPMARMEEIIKFRPSHLVLIDACTLNAPPGTVAILERGHIKDYVPISSHTIPVFIVIDLIIEQIPELHVFMIGIVPESLEGFTELYLYKEGELSIDELNENEDLPFFNIQLTDTLKKVGDQLIEIIKDLIETL